MYPNPQDALPLPPRPDLAQWRKRAKDLVKACKSGDASAIRAWASDWIAALVRLSGNARISESEVARRIDQVTEFARQRLANACSLSEAQFVIARAHGFTSWPKLVDHVEALQARSSAAAFEDAAEAIVNGDLDRLRRLLRDDPSLIRARSTREHNATLLHYVSANGVESYRQRTPPNIVEITRFLLDAGADIAAEADVYGGGSQTLDLVTTSAHPRSAGVQLALAELLLSRGAPMREDIVRYSLANGCPEAAEWLAQRGARVNLEAAAGLGRLADIRVALDGRKLTASDADAVTALFMALWYDRVGVVTYFLDHGLPVDTRAHHTGETPLHIAAYNGSAELVELLLQRGAPIDVRDNRFGTTPLRWAIYAATVEKKTGSGYPRVVRALMERGAEVPPAWLDDPATRTLIGR